MICTEKIIFRIVTLFLAVPTFGIAVLAVMDAGVNHQGLSYFIGLCAFLGAARLLFYGGTGR